MKIFFGNKEQKRKIKDEPLRFPVVSSTLAEYRTGLAGFIDMRAAVSLCMPLAMQIAALHEEKQALPGLRPDTVDIKNRKFVLNEKALVYDGVIYPGFSAPEVYSGYTFGISTDIYTFCALLYYIVIGQAPENAFVRLQKEATPLFSEALIEEISNASSIYLPELRSEEDPFESEAIVRESLLQPTFEIISLSFIEILEKGLSIDAEDRYTSMRELIALLEVFNTRSSTVYPLLLDIDQEKIHSDLILTKTVPVTTYGIKSFLVAKQEAKTASKPASIVESTSQPLPDEDIPTYKETSTQDIIQEVNDIYVEPSIDDSAQQASIEIEQELEIDEDRSNQQQEEFLDEESQDEVAKKDSIVELEDEAEEIDAISEEMDISEEINDVSEETDVVTEQIENDTIPMQNELLNSIIEAIGDKGRLQDESLEDEEVVVQPISVTVTNSTAPTINEVTKSLDDMWELLEKYEKQN